MLTGDEICCCEEDGFVSCGQYHPVNRNLFVIGGSNTILCYDCRDTSRPVQRYVYKDNFGQVNIKLYKWSHLITPPPPPQEDYNSPPRKIKILVLLVCLSVCLSDYLKSDEIFAWNYNHRCVSGQGPNHKKIVDDPDPGSGLRSLISVEVFSLWLTHCLVIIALYK